MKRKDKEELHGMKQADLKKKADELAKQLRQEYLTRETKEVKNRKIVKELRKKRAVTMSILRTKELTETL